MNEKIPFVLELWETGNYYVCSLHDGKKIENLDNVLKLLYLNPKCINTSSLALKPKPKTKTMWVNLHYIPSMGKVFVCSKKFSSEEEAKRLRCYADEYCCAEEYPYIKTVELEVPCDD